jgi:hypothetical protein
MKWFVSLLLLAFASLVPCAGAQSVTVTTPEATLTTPDLSQPGSAGDATDGLGDAAGDVVDSGTASTRTPSLETFRTRFDRLPSRLERLLERIELGRNVAANLKRLEEMLGSVSVRERSRLLRLLNAEVRRLRSGGVSPADRGRIQRLIRTRAALTAPPVPTTTSEVADGTAGTSGEAVAPGTGPRVNEGVLRTYVAPGEARPSEQATPPNGGAGESTAEGDEGRFAPSRLLLALAAVLLIVVAGLAIKEERAT